MIGQIQPTKPASGPANHRTWCHSHPFHGFGFVLFSADLHAEKEAPKALDFSHFFTCMYTQALPQHDKAQHY